MHKLLVNYRHSCQLGQISEHKIKFVLTFSENDQTLVEICTVALYFGSEICQIKLKFVHANPKVLRCLTVLK